MPIVFIVFSAKELLVALNRCIGRSHSSMVVPGHSQVADLLPGFPGWVPREHRGEVVVFDVIEVATGYMEDFSDDGGS